MRKKKCVCLKRFGAFGAVQNRTAGLVDFGSAERHKRTSELLDKFCICAGPSWSLQSLHHSSMGVWWLRTGLLAATTMWYLREAWEATTFGYTTPETG